MARILRPGTVRRFISEITPSDSRKIIYAFDFDGTLAPIVSRPTQVAIPPKIKNLMIQLNQSASVAVISGRSLRDLSPRLGFTPRYTIGNHGMEGIPGRARLESQAFKICRSWLRQLELHPLPAGVEIEDKDLSLSVHYRRTQEPTQVQAWILRHVKKLEPLPHVIGGKFVFNLLSPNPLDKGAALLELMKRDKTQNAVFIGDDLTDEDVFRIARPEIFTIKVGTARSTHARYYIREQKQIASVLKELLESVHKKN